MRRDQALADVTLGATAIGPVLFSTLTSTPYYATGALAVGSAAALTAVRHWLVDMPFPLSTFSNLGLWALYLGGLRDSTLQLATLVLLVLSFALTPSAKALGRLQESFLEGEVSRDSSSDVVGRIYKAVQQTGGISSLAHVFQEINKPEDGRPVSLKDCVKALKTLQDLGEAYKLSSEGNVFVFPGITALNDPLTKSIVELAAGTGTVTVNDLILKLNLTMEVSMNALNRLEQFGIAVSTIEDGVRLYSIKGLAKHYPYTRKSTNVLDEEQILA